MAKKLKSMRRGRICRFIGCKQVLSAYNRSVYCYVHQHVVALQHPILQVKIH